MYTIGSQSAGMQRNTNTNIEGFFFCRWFLWESNSAEFSNHVHIELELVRPKSFQTLTKKADQRLLTYIWTTSSLLDDVDASNSRGVLLCGFARVYISKGCIVMCILLLFTSNGFENLIVTKPRDARVKYICYSTNETCFRSSDNLLLHWFVPRLRATNGASALRTTKKVRAHTHTKKRIDLWFKFRFNLYGQGAKFRTGLHIFTTRRRRLRQRTI